VEGLIDVELLSGRLDGDHPAGPNLEYEPEFQALETAVRGKPQQEFGDKVIPASEPDWKSAFDQALSLAGRTRDLRVAALLTRAATHQNGLDGFVSGLGLIAALLDRLWDSVHPGLDPDDGNDPTMRVNALAALTDPDGLMRDLRGAVFVGAKGFGSCTIRQAESALSQGGSAAGDSAGFTRAQLIGMLGAAASSGLPNHAQLALDHLQRISQILEERAGSQGDVDLKPLRARLVPLAQCYVEAVGGNPATGSDPAESGAVASSGAASGEPRSRDDAMRLLQRACDYLERHEPTNPAPLLIRRAQRLMGMSFIDIVREMAPEGLPSIEKIAGMSESGASE
jgi:type VI secretion system protein ImpA